MFIKEIYLVRPSRPRSDVLVARVVRGPRITRDTNAAPLDANSALHLTST